MSLTTEQQTIFDHVISTEGLTLIDSVAGSGKTTMLVTIANHLPHTNGCYMAYNKSIATEASRKFPKTTHCMTTHKLAYAATVKPYKLRVGDFSYRSIIERISYDMKIEVLDSVKEFCLSRYTDFKDYAFENKLSPAVIKLCTAYLNMMQSGTIECTHEFYLKFYHILLADGTIQYEPFDFIMLDEFGDANEVTIEIFRLLPAKRKIAVGDPFQNIYTFNHTVNGFDVLKDEGTLFRMSQSFRVADYIATRIDKFCVKYLDPDMQFKGVQLSDTIIKSRGFITRTNGALISKMIELNQTSTPYGLVRSVNEIFRIPLMLVNIKYEGIIQDSAYKHLQSDINDWFESDELQDRYSTVLSYLSKTYEDDMQLAQAISLVLKYKKATIMATYAEAKKHEKTNQSYTLATAHSCKGLEFDEVTLSTDMNNSVEKTLDKLNSGFSRSDLARNEIESLNLYYVACSRAAKVLNNAIYLPN
jgi:superfamily I DNA/RNA helicase